MPSIEIHGVYKIPAPHPCFIVEMTIRDSQSELDLTEVNFEVKHARRKTSIQVPFEEHFLSPEGEVKGNFKFGWDHPEIWNGNPRLAFLMHYLEPGRALKTPYGNVVLPEPTECPQRLKAIKYVSPY